MLFPRLNIASCSSSTRNLPIQLGGFVLVIEKGGEAKRKASPAWKYQQPIILNAAFWWLRVLLKQLFKKLFILFLWWYCLNISTNTRTSLGQTMSNVWQLNQRVFVGLCWFQLSRHLDYEYGRYLEVKDFLTNSCPQNPSCSGKENVKYIQYTFI